MLRLLTVIFIVSTLIGCFDSHSGEKREPKGLIENESVRPVVMIEGDVIFRRGTGLWSPMISGSNQSKFSHIGVIVKKSGQWFVAHADADDLTWTGGVHLTDLDEFLEESVIFRIKRNLMSAVQKHVFLQYIWKHVDLETKFDSDFMIDEAADELYCTEYVWLAGLSAGVRLGEPVNIMGKPYITLDAIFNSHELL